MLDVMQTEKDIILNFNHEVGIILVIWKHDAGSLLGHKENALFVYDGLDLRKMCQ